MDRRASGLIALSGASLPLASCWPLPPLHFEARGLPRSKAVIFPVFSPALSALWTPPGLFCALFSGRRKENRNFFEKKYCFFGRVMVLYQSRHDATEYGRLAQLVEHLLDVQEVTGSSPVPSTTKIPSQMTWDFLRGRDRTRTARPRRRRGKQQPSATTTTAASGRNREELLGPRSDFSKPCQGAAEKSANATRCCCLVRGFQSSGISTKVVRTRFSMRKGSGTFFVYRRF